MRWFVKIKFEPRDVWIGVFWDKKPKGSKIQYWDIYICLVPLFPIRVFQGIKF